MSSWVEAVKETASKLLSSSDGAAVADDAASVTSCATFDATGALGDDGDSRLSFPATQVVEEGIGGEEKQAKADATNDKQDLISHSTDKRSTRVLDDDDDEEEELETELPKAAKPRVVVHDDDNSDEDEEEEEKKSVSKLIEDVASDAELDKVEHEGGTMEQDVEEKDADEDILMASQDSEENPMEQQLREFEESEKNQDDSKEDHDVKAVSEAQNKAEQAKEERNINKYAHCPGRSTLDVTMALGDEPAIVTGGGDGNFRVFMAANNADQDFRSTFEIDSEVTCLATHPTRAIAAVGTGDGTVKLHSLETGEEEELLCRLSGPVRDVAFNSDGSKLAIGTSDHLIKVIDVAEPTKITEISGPLAPVRALAWQPAKTPLTPSDVVLGLIACTSMDGNVYVYKLADDGGSYEAYYHVNGALVNDKSDDMDSPYVDRLGWSPNAQYLAIPGQTTVRIFDASAGTCTQPNLNAGDTIDCGFSDKCTVATFSPSGDYLALTSASQEMAVVRRGSSTNIATAGLKLDDKSFAYDLKWVPGRNDLAAMTDDGNLHVFRNVIPSSHPNPGTVAVPNNEVVAMDDDDDNAADKMLDESEPREQVNFNDEDEENDNIGQGQHEDDTQTRQHAMSTFTKDEVDARIRAALAQEAALRPVRQPAFQPSSTEETSSGDDEDDEGRRYLVWNAVGSISMRRGDAYNSIEITFADSDKRPAKFSDHYGFEMGALSESGAVFASPGSFQKRALSADEDRRGLVEPEEPSDSEDWDPELDPSSFGQIQQESLEELQDRYDRIEMGRGTAEDHEIVAGKRKSSQKSDEDLYGECGTVYYRPFNPWAVNSDWTLRLPNKEKARCVTAGKDFAAVATSRRTLRIIRANGLQEAPILLPGPVVSLAAVASMVLVAYHRAEPAANGTQSLGYTLYNVGREENAAESQIAGVVAQGIMPVPVREPRALRWLGFTDASMGFMPCYIDAKGALLGLSAGMAWNWVFLCDTHSLKDVNIQRGDRVWPVSVQSGKLIAVVLKHGVRVPAVYPAPQLTGLEMQVPLLGLQQQTGALKYQMEALTAQKRLVLDQVKWSKDQNQGREGNGGLLTESALREEEAQLDASIIKHIVLAVKLKKSTRALGLLKRLRSLKMSQAAVNQARKQGADASLMQKMERFLVWSEKQADALDNDDSDSDSDSGSESESESESENEQSRSAEQLDVQKRCGPKTEKSLLQSKQGSSPVIGNRKRLSAGAPSETVQDLEDISESDSDQEAEFDTSKQTKSGVKRKSESELSDGESEEEEEQLVTKPKPAKNFKNPFAASGAAKKQPAKSKPAGQGLLSSFINTPAQLSKTKKRRKY